MEPATTDTHLMHYFLLTTNKKMPKVTDFSKVFPSWVNCFDRVIIQKYPRYFFSEEEQHNFANQ